jgi:6-phosphogluconolactonase
MLDHLPIHKFDKRRSLLIGKDREEAIRFAAHHFVRLAQDSIILNNKFAVALSGGSTPAAIFSLLASSPLKEQLNWSKVLLFWSDERAVGPTHPESNFRMAMEAGFAHLPIPSHHIFRMQAEHDIDHQALLYEERILKELGPELFDLVMLGMGEDGHTASLFPGTKALIADPRRLVVSNFIPEKKSYRMTLTLGAINHSRHSCLYVLGKSKAEMVNKILINKEDLPAGRVGTPERKALWILDQDAAVNLPCTEEV